MPGISRCLSDLAVGGQPVRFCCRCDGSSVLHTDCARATFVEQVDDLTTRYGRAHHAVAWRAGIDRVGVGGPRRGAVGRASRAAGGPDDTAAAGAGAARPGARRGHRRRGRRLRVAPRTPLRGYFLSSTSTPTARSTCCPTAPATPSPIDGIGYTIDLGPKNAKAFRKSLDRYVEHATAPVDDDAPTPRDRPSGRSTQTRAIREWARTNGYEISDRGRIPTDIV